MTLPDTGPVTLAGVTLTDGRRVDVCLREGRVAGVTPAGSAGAGTSDRAGGTQRLDLDGWLLLPAPAEPHAHLDKALTADAVDNPSGDLAGAIAAWLRHRPTLTHEEIVGRATAAVSSYLAHGATAVRSHVDIGTENGLRALHAMREVRDAVRHAGTLQLVAFVGVPLTGIDGADHRALLRDALAAGADVVGGCPWLDPDPVRCVEHCLAAGADHELPVDLHVDETLDPAADSLRALATAVGDGYPYGAAASHCVSLGAQPPAEVRLLAGRLARAGIVVVCAPQTNLFLQGRDRTVPGAAGRPRGLAPLDILTDAGVTVAAGGDNLQDPFNPVGRGDPLETAALLVLAGHRSPSAAYQAVSTHARAALGLPAVRVEPGAPAELLAIRAGSLRGAIAGASPDRVVIHGGGIVARTSVTRELSLPAVLRKGES